MRSPLRIGRIGLALTLLASPLMHASVASAAPPPALLTVEYSVVASNAHTFGLRCHDFTASFNGVTLKTIAGPAVSFKAVAPDVSSFCTFQGSVPAGQGKLVFSPAAKWTMLNADGKTTVQIDGSGTTDQTFTVFAGRPVDAKDAVVAPPAPAATTAPIGSTPDGTLSLTYTLNSSILASYGLNCAKIVATFNGQALKSTPGAVSSFNKTAPDAASACTFSGTVLAGSGKVLFSPALQFTKYLGGTNTQVINGITQSAESYTVTAGHTTTATVPVVVAP